VWSAPRPLPPTLRALEHSRVLSSVLRQLVGLVRQFERPGGLVFGLLGLLVCLFGVFLGELCALVGLVGLLLRLLGLLVGLVGLVLGLLCALVCLVGLDLRLLRLLRGLGGLVLGLLCLLVGLVGLVLRLPRGVGRLLCAAPGLLRLLAGSLRLVESQLDSVADPIHVLADVLAGGQFPQHASVLLAPVLLFLFTTGIGCSLYILRRRHDYLPMRFC
jgi:hypothetical protein